MLKNGFPLYGKVASTFKNLGKSLKISKNTGVHTFLSSFQIDFPQVSITISE